MQPRVVPGADAERKLGALHVYEYRVALLVRGCGLAQKRRGSLKLAAQRVFQRRSRVGQRAHREVAARFERDGSGELFARPIQFAQTQRVERDLAMRLIEPVPVVGHERSRLERPFGVIAPSLEVAMHRCDLEPGLIRVRSRSPIRYRFLNIAQQREGGREIERRDAVVTHAGPEQVQRRRGQLTFEGVDRLPKDVDRSRSVAAIVQLRAEGGSIAREAFEVVRVPIDFAGAPKPANSAGETSERSQRQSDLVMQAGDRAIGALALGERAFVIGYRVGERADAEGSVAGEFGVECGAFAVAGAPPMVGQFDADGAVVGTAFQFEPDCLVQRAYALGEQFAVKHLLREGVSEGQFAGRRSFGADQLQRLGAFECEQYVVARTVPERHQPVDGEALAEHGGQGQNLSLVVGQQRRPRQDGSADRQGQLTLPPGCLSREGALQQLFGEERIALTSPDDVCDRCGVERIRIGKREFDQRVRRALIQGFERYLRDRLLLQQRCEVGEARVIATEFVAAIRRQHEHAPARDAVGEIAEKVQRRAIGPMDVLDREDDRPALGIACEGGIDRFEQPARRQRYRRRGIAFEGQALE